MCYNDEINNLLDKSYASQLFYMILSWDSISWNLQYFRIYIDSNLKVWEPVINNKSKSWEEYTKEQGQLHLPAPMAMCPTGQDDCIGQKREEDQADHGQAPLLQGCQAWGMLAM